MKETIKDELGTEFIPEFITKKETILVPKKTHKSIDFISEELLLTINPNVKVAKELCLYFLSMLTSTVFVENESDDESRYKSLLSSHLATYFRKNGLSINTKDTKTYANIIKVLKNGTPEQGAFIIVDERYVAGEKSRKYRLSDCYSIIGHQSYKLTTSYVKNIVYRNQMDFYSKAHCNVIAKNSLHFYGEIEIPSSEQLLIKGKQLVKENFITKKNKKLTMLYKQNKDHWKDSDNRSFIEDNIKKFEYYTANGFMIPIIGGEHCPRIYDSISLIPSWIRNEIKVDGEKLVECDFKCLHPNLIMKLYKGVLKYITHEKIAVDLGLNKNDVKIMHLSFFNMEIKHLENSPLYKYYNEKEPLLMKWLLLDKQTHGHKYTSTLLFILEVQIMTEVIKRLNAMNIFVGYGYDALFTNESNKTTVEDMMNIVIKEFDVYTATYDKNKTSNDVETKNNETILETKEMFLDDSIDLYSNEEIFDYVKNKLTYLVKTDVATYRNKCKTIEDIFKYLKNINSERKPKQIKVQIMTEINERHDKIELESELFNGGNINKAIKKETGIVIEEESWYDSLKNEYPVKKKNSKLTESLDIF